MVYDPLPGVVTPPAAASSAPHPVVGLCIRHLDGRLVPGPFDDDTDTWEAR